MKERSPKGLRQKAVGRQRTPAKSAAGEAILQGQEVCWQALVENADDLILLCDPLGRLVYVNPATMRISGYREEELLGRPYLDFVAPSHREEVGGFYRRQLDEKMESTYLQAPMMASQGEELWLAQRVQLLMAGETVHGWQIMARDITEQRRVRDALQKAESRYRNLVENSPDFIYYLDAQGRLVSMNESGMLGFSPDEPGSPLGQHFINYIYPEDRERVLQSFAEAVAAHQSTTKGLTFRLVRKDGEVIWVELHSRMLFDEEGRYLEEVGILRDVTDRKKMEERLIALNQELKRTNQDLQAAYQWMRERRDQLKQRHYEERVGFLVDREGKIEWFSEAALAFTGRSRTDLIGNNLQTLLDEESRPSFRQALQQAWISTIYPLTVRIAAHDGEDAVMEVSITRLSSADARLLWVMFQPPT